MSASEAARPAKKRSGLFWWGVRLAGSAVVLFIVFRFVPVQEVWRELRQLPPWLWAAALIGFLLGHFAAAVKWRLLIGPGVSMSEAFRAHLAGLAANLCLPGVAGGDVVRAGLVAKSAQNVTQLAVGSVVDRVLDTLGLVLITAIAGMIAFGSIGGASSGLLLLLAGGLALALVGGFALAAPVARWLGRSRSGTKLGKMLDKAATVCSEVARKPGRLAACLAISLCVQMTFIGLNLAFAVAAHVDAPAAAWAFAWAAAKIIVIAPISLGGLGAREGSMAALLTPFGADPAKVIAVGLIWQTLLYASGLLGALAQLFWTPNRARSPQAEPSGALPEVP